MELNLTMKRLAYPLERKAFISRKLKEDGKVMKKERGQDYVLRTLKIQLLTSARMHII